MTDRIRILLWDICSVMRLQSGYLLLSLAFLLGSCMKDEAPIALPPATESVIDQVAMGDEYQNQIYYNLESGEAVKVSDLNAWDLAFEADPLGTHIFLNGGKDIYLYPTGQYNIAEVKTIPDPKKIDWKFDAACGLADSTAFGTWNQGPLSKGEVFVLKMNPAHFADTFKKIALVMVDEEKYVFSYGNLREDDIQTMTIYKDPAYNYAYFSFADQRAVQPEPPKESWDLVFTRYRYIYHELDDFPYLVVGALLNPYQTLGAELDSNGTFAAVKTEDILSASFSDFRDVIGFDWKTYDIDKGLYTVNQQKVYLVRNARDQYYKIHFLDFYGQSPSSGQREKGNPRFEYERLR